MAAYSIDIRPRARRALRELDPPVRRTLGKAIEDLTNDPRPPGVRALKGYRPYLRVQVGTYRVIYSVDDQARVVTIAVVGHRREVYRNLDL